MRFVLYIITWIFVVQTISELVQGAFDEFTAGLFVSGLMVWWSVSVRNRRKRKLAAAAGDQVEAKQSNWDRATGELKEEAKSLLSRKPSPTPVTYYSAPEIDLESRPQEEVLREQAQSNAPAIVEPQTIENPRDETPALATEPFDESNTFDGSGLTFTSEEDDEAGLENEPKVDRPVWTDAHGKELHVGAKVTFFANSRGQSVAIPGVLLGERDGKALIEVGSGALLPKNDYSIPWNVVSLVD